MQLNIERFETKIVEDFIQKEIVTLLFDPNDLRARNMNNLTAFNENRFEIVFDYENKKILNEKENIHFVIEEDRKIKQKLSLNEMLKLSNIYDCILVAVEQKYFGHYSYSDEAIGLFREMEQLNKERLINKALETGDKQLFMKLTKGVV